MEVVEVGLSWITSDGGASPSRIGSCAFPASDESSRTRIRVQHSRCSRVLFPHLAVMQTSCLPNDDTSARASSWSGLTIVTSFFFGSSPAALWNHVTAGVDPSSQVLTAPFS